MNGSDRMVAAISNSSFDPFLECILRVYDRPGGVLRLDQEDGGEADLLLYTSAEFLQRDMFGNAELPDVVGGGDADLDDDLAVLRSPKRIVVVWQRRGDARVLVMWALWSLNRR